MADPTAASAPPATAQTNVSVTLGGKWADRKKKNAEIAREKVASRQLSFAALKAAVEDLAGRGVAPLLAFE